MAPVSMSKTNSDLKNCHFERGEAISPFEMGLPPIFQVFAMTPF